MQIVFDSYPMMHMHIAHCTMQIQFLSLLGRAANNIRDTYTFEFRVVVFVTVSMQSDVHKGWGMGESLCRSLEFPYSIASFQFGFDS